MESEERVGFHFRVPPRNVDGKKEHRPTHEQNYLFVLVPLGMNILNRELSLKNFPVLTQALGLNL